MNEDRCVLLLPLSSLQAINEDRVLLSADVVLVLDTNGELEFNSRELTDLAPVTTVEELFVFEIVTSDVLIEDICHLL
jgi:hypothetical protein